MSIEREIIEIPAMDCRGGEESQKLRVAAYCRVSTNQETQQNSYQAQKAYYLEMIESHPNWVLADIFADGPVKIGLNQKHPTARGALV